jgi:hypothetical protein
LPATSGFPDEEGSAGNEEGETKAQACIQSGGVVATKDCCEGVEDFPDLCDIGACGCRPDGKNIVRICDCRPGRCFAGDRCVERTP